MIRASFSIDTVRFSTRMTATLQHQRSERGSVHYAGLWQRPYKSWAVRQEANRRRYTPRGRYVSQGRTWWGHFSRSRKRIFTRHRGHVRQVPAQAPGAFDPALGAFCLASA
ncbi:hypothetical protein MRX96_041546 [Rhipicephalus microplus]